METWRIRLLYAAVIVFVSGYITELYLFPFARGPLYVLLASYFVSFAGLLYRKTDIRILTAKVAIASLCMVIAGGLVILVIMYGDNQQPVWGQHWYYSLSALMGAAVVFLSWEKAKKPLQDNPNKEFELEALPSRTIDTTLDWDALDRQWRDNPQRLLHLRSLRRIHLLNEKGC